MKTTMKIDSGIHSELKDLMGFQTFDNLFRALLDFRKAHKKEWNKFTKGKE